MRPPIGSPRIERANIFRSNPVLLCGPPLQYSNLPLCFLRGYLPPPNYRREEFPIFPLFQVVAPGFLLPRPKGRRFSLCPISVPCHFSWLFRVSLGILVSSLKGLPFPHFGPFFSAFQPFWTPQFLCAMLGPPWFWGFFSSGGAPPPLGH